MSAIFVRRYFGGSRVLVAEDEAALPMQFGTSLFRTGITVLGPATTLSETRALVSKAKPTVAVLGPFAGGLGARLFMIELFEHHLPALFYVKVPTPLPLLALGDHSLFVERADENELLSAIAALSRPHCQRAL